MNTMRLSRILLVLAHLPLAGCVGNAEVGVERTPLPPASAPKGETSALRPQIGSDFGKIAYIFEGDIYVLESPGAPATRLTSSGQNIRPSWSASGDWLLFVRDRALWRMRKDGSGAKPVIAPVAPELYEWSPIEDLFAHVSEEGALKISGPHGDSPGGILIPDVIPGGRQRVMDFDWSPDGQWLAAVLAQWDGNDLGNPPTRMILRVIRRDGDSEKDLIEVSAISDGEALALAGWAGDGEHIFFWKGSASASIQADGMQLCSISAETGNLLSYDLYSPTGGDFFSILPGHAKAAFVIGSGRYPYADMDIALIDAASPQWNKLTDTGGAISSPALSPDGKYVAYEVMPSIDANLGPEDMEGAYHANIGMRKVEIVPVRMEDESPIAPEQEYREESPLWSSDGEYLMVGRVSEGRASLWLRSKLGNAEINLVEELSPFAGHQGFDAEVIWEDYFDWWQKSNLITEPLGRMRILFDGGAAQDVVVRFLQATLAKEFESALNLWHLDDQSMSGGSSEFFEDLIKAWSESETTFDVGLTKYRAHISGDVLSGLSEDDPRVTDAIVQVDINGFPAFFTLTKIKGEWLINGIMQPTSLPPAEGMSFLPEGILYLRGRELRIGSRERDALLASIPENAQRFEMQFPMLAYKSGDSLKIVDLRARSTVAELPLPADEVLHLDLRWSDDVSALAYSVAWLDTDGTHRINLGTFDGYQTEILDEITMPRIEGKASAGVDGGAEFVGIDILVFDRETGTIIATPVGGSDRYAELWYYREGTSDAEIVAMQDALGSQLAQVDDIHELTVSPKGEWIAVSYGRSEGQLAIFSLVRDVDMLQVEMLENSHASDMTWSPNGGQLAYLLRQGAAPSLDISPATRLGVADPYSGQWGAERELPSMHEARILGWGGGSDTILIHCRAGFNMTNAVVLVDLETEAIETINIPDDAVPLGWIAAARDK
ncbi:MAG TPA: hypothetical protein ENL35_05350 [Chloroflexi bacterium]|nr:hypothetical protein [Chloroflexota bacterium]